MTQAELADRAGVDRSTISAALASGLPRLPNGHLVGAMAETLGVSTDWLLGLSSTHDSVSTILSRSLEVRAASRLPVDEQVERWHDEAIGLKVRNVPASLPAIAKTAAVLRVEYGEWDRPMPEGAAGDDEGVRRVADSDLEMCLPVQRLRGLIAREGLWAALGERDVDEQIERLQALHESLYPRMRVYLYDAARHYSAPITIFGAHRAIVYLGRSYFAFTTREHILELTGQFDALVRDACVQAHEFGTWLDARGKA